MYKSFIGSRRGCLVLPPQTCCFSSQCRPCRETSGFCLGDLTYLPLLAVSETEWRETSSHFPRSRSKRHEKNEKLWSLGDHHRRTLIPARPSCGGCERCSPFFLRSPPRDGGPKDDAVCPLRTVWKWEPWRVRDEESRS